MSDDRQRELDREQRLLKLEAYESIQEELLAWLKRKFWWQALLSGIGATVLVGGTGYGVIHFMLRDVEKSLIRAQAFSEQADESAEQASKEVLIAQKDGRAIADRLDEADVLAKNFTARLADLAINEDTLRAGMKDVERRLDSLGSRVVAVAELSTETGAVIQKLISQVFNQTLPDRVRSGASDSLAEYGDESAVVLPELKQLFRSGDWVVQGEFSSLGLSLARSIAKIEGGDSLEYFVEILKNDSGEDVHEACLYGIAQLPFTNLSIDAVIEMSQSGNEGLRESATDVLGGYGQFPDEQLRQAAVVALAAALKDDADDVRYSAILSLSSHGSKAKGALPALYDLRDNPRGNSSVYEFNELAKAIFVIENSLDD